MGRDDDFLICVNADWKGWRSAYVRLADLQDLHWRQPIGAPHAMVHGYVSCTDIVTGELPHDCETFPHRVLVCVLKSHTVPAVYAELVRRIGAEQAFSSTSRRSGGVPGRQTAGAKVS